MRFAYLIAGVVAIWLAAPFLVAWIIPSGDGQSWGMRGQFGDMFGAVNSLFSGLAFAGLFWALRLQGSQLELQRNELSLQREELKLQREEMAASRAELANQVAAQRGLFRAQAAQVAVAAMQARIQAFSWEAYNFNAQSDARARFAAPIREIADDMDRMYQDLTQTLSDADHGIGAPDAAP